MIFKNHETKKKEEKNINDGSHDLVIRGPRSKLLSPPFRIPSRIDRNKDFLFLPDYGMIVLCIYLFAKVYFNE